MKLSVEQIESVLQGSVRIIADKDTVKPMRFTKEQSEYYKYDEFYYMESAASAGVKLVFKTDSKSLYLHIFTEQGGAREYFSLDVFVNGCAVGYIDNFTGKDLPKEYPLAKLAHGDFSKEFMLGEGNKEVCVHLPWSMSTVIKEISIDDGSFVEPIKPKRTLLAYGDSITQGYDALRPSNRYIARLADKIGAEEINKGIGGEKFSPKLALLEDEITPDYIMVAYGTNDWTVYNEETFRNNCSEFCHSVRKNYPTAEMFVLTPIWRKNLTDKTEFGAFENIDKAIREEVRDIEGLTVISCFDFVPKDESYFADFHLHPNDNGFEKYFDSLYNEVRRGIK